MKFKLDEIDYKVLDLLIDNSRIPYTDIAKKLLISAGTVHVRIKKMEDAGIISGSSLKLDYKKLGYTFIAYIGIFLEKTHLTNEVLEKLNSIGFDLSWGDDFGYKEEKALTQDLTSPMYITNFPREKGFYHRPDPNDPKSLVCHDLLAPEGYGEIIGGGERVWSPDELTERIREEGLEPESYGWYLDIRKFGSVPHSGFGLGIDRTVSWICGSDHIKHVIPFPRTMRRTTP